jgi:enoyl-CoA hydratase/carnithine racemase
MEQRAYNTIVLSAAGRAGVAHVTLNRPERRNAIGPEMMNELLWVLADAADDPEIRSIVITGAGKAFCSGGDFAQIAAGGEAGELPVRGDFKDLLLQMCRTPKPIIARVNGAALGGGLGLVAASTFAVASSDAKLGTPEINVGLFPFMILAVLERVMPRRRLVEMMLAGEILGAEEAQKVGLLNKVVPPEELDAAVDAYIDLVAEKSPLTVRLGLSAVCDTEALTLEEKLPILSERLMACLGTEDAREGLSAFLQKRKPNWTGR